MRNYHLTSDYRNEMYFEDWGASPQLTDRAHYLEDVTPKLTRNGTDGRVYGGDCNLIHIPDGRRADVGRQMAQVLDATMRAMAENRTEEERASQLLCPGCSMVAIFNMAVECAKANGQPLSELGNSLGDAFKALANGGADRIEHIVVKLDN